ncbi:MAG TPA: hypothetical protein VE130_13635 [Nitrososphaeraceae archaeon]|nr:hypothetical protein [Nitrososphaeraceae archaeon]
MSGSCVMDEDAESSHEPVDTSSQIHNQELPSRVKINQDLGLGLKLPNELNTAQNIRLTQWFPIG